MTKSYATILVSDYDALNTVGKASLIANAVNTSFADCRKSIDGTLFLIKWLDGDPVVGIDHTDYTYGQAKTLMDSDNNWIGV